jgi:hypothetical protein
MDDVTIQMDTLVVELGPADAAAVAAGRLDALGPAIVAALRDHPAARAYVPAGATIVTSRSDPGRDTRESRRR